MSTMTLHTSAFEDFGRIPDVHTKDHEDLSPPLEWSDTPGGAVEYVITCVDPDAPGGTFVHWLVAGIPADAWACDEGKPPVGAVEGVNSFGNVGYNGPQPPRGDKAHRYFFQVHALNRHFDLAEGFTYDVLQRDLAEAEIAVGTVVGIFDRP